MYRISTYIRVKSLQSARNMAFIIAENAGVNLIVLAEDKGLMHNALYFRVNGTLVQIERFVYYMNGLRENGLDVGPLIVKGQEEPLPTGKEWRTRLLRFKNWVRRIGK